MEELANKLKPWIREQVALEKHRAVVFGMGSGIESAVIAGNI